MTTPDLHPYVPRLLVRRLAAAGHVIPSPFEERIGAAVLVADITGFTALTERLAASGPAGAERLTEIVNASFGTIIESVEAHGGDLLTFAGDATVAVWPADSDDRRDALERAAACGLEMQSALGTQLPVEGTALQIRVGLDVGRIWAGGVGGVDGRWLYLIGGNPIAGAGIAATRAAPGEMVATAAAAALVTDRAETRSPDERYHVIEALRGEGPPPSPRTIPLPPVPLTAYVPRQIAAREAVGLTGWLAEFRRVTIVFVGIADLDYDAADTLTVVQQATEAMQETVYRFGGSVNQLVADEKGTTLVAAWGLPSSTHEDDPARGTEAALRLVERLQRLGLAAAAGATTGRVFTGLRGNARRREYAMLGDTVNLAARLMQAAEGGVLCDGDTSRAAGTRVRVDALPPIRVKGKADAIPVFRPAVAAEPASAPRKPGATTVGRAKEIEIIRQRVAHLRRGDGGGVLLLEGEAGIGKSQLVARLLEESAETGVRCLVGEADPIEQSTPYYVWREPLHALLNGSGGDHAQMRRRVQEAVAGDARLAERAPLLNDALPLEIPETMLTARLESEARAEGLRELVAHLLTQGAKDVPLVLVLEDTHWIDSSSWALTVHVARRVPGVLLVLATRPPAEPVPAEYAQILREPRAAKLALGPLEPEAAVALVAQRLGVEMLPEPVARFIAAKAEGNPFFSEQLAYALRDGGHLVVDGGTCRLARDVSDLDALDVPDTVQGVISGRIDRLGPAEQLTVKVASVIGRLFPYGILSAVHPIGANGGTLRAHLDRFVRLDLTVLDRPDPDLAYLFKHVITQDVAYEMLAFAQRRQLHRAVAEWYERHTEDLEPHLPLLAHHWTRAEVPAKAVEYLGRAGRQALERNANAEALRFLRQASTLDREQGGLVSDAARAAWEQGQGIALVKLSRYRESREHFEAALRLSGQLVPSTAAGVAVDLVGQLGRQLWHRLRRTRRTARDPVLTLRHSEAHRYLTEVSYWRNDYLRLMHHNLHSVNAAEAAGDSKELVVAFGSLAFILGLSTLHGAARYYRRLSERVGDRVGDLDATAYTAEIEAVYFIVQAEWDRARAVAERGARIFRELGDRMRWHTCFSLQGYAHLYQGQFDRGRPFFEEGARIVVPDGAVQAQIWSLGALLATDLVQDTVRADSLTALDALLGPAVHHADEIFVRGLLAAARARQGDDQGALAHARIAAPMVHQFPPASWHSLAGAAAIAELYLTRWERDGAHAASPWRAAAHRAIRGVERFARINRFAQPRARLLRGRYHRVAGRDRRARRVLDRGRATADRLAMPYESALAHLELAALEVAAAERRRHADRAVALLEPLGAPLDLARARRLSDGTS